MTGARKIRVVPQMSPHVRLLLAIRTQRHWTQQQLADAIGVARTTVSRWERGERDLHPAWLKLVRGLLGNDMDGALRSNHGTSHDQF